MQLAAVGMRFIFILLCASALLCRAGENLTGRWEGSIQIPERELKLVVDLAQANGGWIGSLIVPGLGLNGAPLTNITAENSDASFTIKTARGLEATFKGHVTGDGTLAGSFMQAGNTAPFSLKKVGSPQVELPPRSTAVAKQLEGEWKGEYELFGYPRKVSLKLSNHGTDSATAEFVVVGKKVNNLPVDLVTQEGDLLTIESHAIGIGYEGKVGKDGAEIVGTFNQGTLEIPLTLRREK